MPANEREVKIRIAYDIPTRFPDQDIDSVLQIAFELNIPVHIAFNLIYKESSFDSTADNGRCGGYMQLNRKYFTWNNRFENLRRGFVYLKEKYDESGSWYVAVNMYNSNSRNGSRKSYVDYILNEHK